LSQIDDAGTQTLSEYARLIWARIWLVAVVTVVIGAGAFLIANSQTRIYKASARLMYVQPADLSNPTAGDSSISVDSLTIVLQSVGGVVDGPAVRTQAMDSAGGEAKGLKYAVTSRVVSPQDSTGNSFPDSVEIEAQTTSPTAAASIANAYAAAVIARRKQGEQERYRAAQRVIRDQLALSTSPQSKLTADYAILVQQLRNLQIAEATATGDFEVIVPATPPRSPASPRPVRSAALGLVLGLFGGVGLALVVGSLDTRVHTHRQASEILGLPVLGRVPRIHRHTLRQSSLVALTEPDGHFSEALRMLRTNLDWAGIDDRLSSLLITSCIKGEGKTITVCNLAVALARSGKKVIVVDADLRDPQVHMVLGLRNGVGLTSVALGKVEVKDALQVFKPLPSAAPIRLKPSASPMHAVSSIPAPEWVGNLRVLTSGPLPPDPGEVVASRRLASTLKEIASLEADYLLLDTPPILSVGDAGALSASVDGLLMVVNLEKARRPTLVDGREQLDALPCRKAGIVVVGERIDHEEYYKYKTTQSQGV
jgi:Mrp family chromosome partitioning ATPase/capsular polysaccharide biosynthesis protein